MSVNASAPPLFLLTIKKASRTDYDRDILTLMALPEGAIFRFRYRLRYLDRALGTAAKIQARGTAADERTALSEAETENLEKLLSSRTAWIVLYDETSSKYLPLRRVTITRAEVKGGFVRLAFSVGKFAEYNITDANASEAYRSHVEPVHVASSQDVFGQTYRKGGHALVLVGSELPDEAPDIHDDDWQRVVLQLQRLDRFSDYTFVAVVGLYRSLIPEQRVEITEGYYSLVSGMSYVLQLQHSRLDKPENPDAIELTTFTDHLVPLQSDVKLNGRYDVSDLRFAVKKRIDSIVSYVAVRSDLPNVPEFELELRLKARYDAYDVVSVATMAVMIVINSWFVWYTMQAPMALKDSFVALAAVTTAFLTLMQRIAPKERV